MTHKEMGTVGHGARGRCHRCGWTSEVTKVSRYRAQELHMGRHAALLCAECIADLERVGTSAARPAAAIFAATSGTAMEHRHRVA